MNCYINLQKKKSMLRREAEYLGPFHMVKTLLKNHDSFLFNDFAEENDLMTFIIVRDPIKRLISAFKDKLERSRESNPTKQWWSLNFGQKIVSRFRKKAEEKFGVDFFKQENNSLGSVEKFFHNKKQPIFWEFIQYLKTIRKKDYDIHWMPMVDLCTPCSIRFNNVIKFEHLSQEAPFLIKMIDPNKTLSLEHENPTSQNRTENEFLSSYMTQLSEEDIRALWKIYEYDFRLFGYELSWKNLRFP